MTRLAKIRNLSGNFFAKKIYIANEKLWKIPGNYNKETHRNDRMEGTDARETVNNCNNIKRKNAKKSKQR